jgi:hypothetical protein
MMYDEAWFRELLRRLYAYVLSRNWVERFGFEEGKVVGYRLCEHLLTVLVCLKRDRFQPDSEWRALRLGGEGQEDEKRRMYVGIDLLPDYVSAIVLGPRSPQSEAELKALLDGTPYCRTSVSRSRLSM